MNKRDNILASDSCWNKAHDLEEVFVILGRDPAARATVIAWANERIALGINKPEDEQIQSALRMFNN